MPISVSQPQVVSANIGYLMPIDYDEFVDTFGTQESLIGTGVVPSISFKIKDPLSETANIGYLMPIDYDEFVDTFGTQESLIGTGVVPQIQSTQPNPLANLSFGNIPTVTYVVTDGSPIILVSVYNTQYWSTS